MCSDLFSAVSQLHSAGLHSNVVELGALLEAQAIHNPELLTQAQLTQLHIYQGDSLLELREWRRAETQYQKSQQARKQYLKSRGLRSPGSPPAPPAQAPLGPPAPSAGGPQAQGAPPVAPGGAGGDPKEVVVTPEVEVKYRLHSCYVALGQPNQAVNVLQSIVARQREAKVSMALGRLYQAIGMERPAVAAYREVVRECPLAIEAIRALLMLGVKPREIQELGGEAHGQLLASNQINWLGGWLAGQAALHSRDYEVAVKELRQLEEGGGGSGDSGSPPLLKGCVSVLVDSGLGYQWAGHQDQAIRVLQRAQAIDRQLLRGMDSLAALLAAQGRTRELETLATRLMEVSEEAPQPWVALGHFCHLNKKSPRAVYFAHKACLLDTRNVEALLLKGNVLLDLKKLPDAMNHFREAMQIASHRFEAHKGMVDCYLGLSRQREAVTVATGACKNLSNSPRALTLYARVLLKEPLSVARAKSLLERAAGVGHLPAVYLLADLLDREGTPNRGIELLQRQLSHSHTARLHQLLADLLAKSGQEDAAMEHYSHALALDPKNEVSGPEEAVEAVTSEKGDSPLPTLSSPHLAMLDLNRRWGN